LLCFDFSSEEFGCLTVFYRETLSRFRYFTDLNGGNKMDKFDDVLISNQHFPKFCLQKGLINLSLLKGWRRNL
jgi:hypothetical protein